MEQCLLGKHCRIVFNDERINKTSTAVLKGKLFVLKSSVHIEFTCVCVLLVTFQNHVLNLTPKYLSLVTQFSRLTKINILFSFLKREL